MTKDYGPYGDIALQAMLVGMRVKGMTVTGNNPWTIDTKKHGVVLGASFDEDTRMLTVSIIEKPWYAPASAVFSKLDEAMPKPSILTAF